MKKRIKTFFAAFDAFLIIWASANYGQSLTRNTVEKRSKATWERVGLHLRSSKLPFSINEQAMDANGILFLSSYSLVEKLGHDFIRMTLSRFSNNLYMAIRQINARATQISLSDDISFLLCRIISKTKAKKIGLNSLF